MPILGLAHADIHLDTIKLVLAVNRVAELKIGRDSPGIEKSRVRLTL